MTDLFHIYMKSEGMWIVQITDDPKKVLHWLASTAPSEVYVSVVKTHAHSVGGKCLNMQKEVRKYV